MHILKVLKVENGKIVPILLQPRRREEQQELHTSSSLTVIVQWPRQSRKTLKKTRAPPRALSIVYIGCSRSGRQFRHVWINILICSSAGISSPVSPLLYLARAAGTSQ